MKNTIVALAILAVAGCASQEPLRVGDYEDEPIDLVFALWGKPIGRGPLGDGGTQYVFERALAGETAAGDDETYHCQLTVFTDDDGIVTRVRPAYGDERCANIADDDPR